MKICINMKKSFFYASILAVLFASCSNSEDGLTPQIDMEQPGGNVVNELKISLVSGTEVGTRTTPGQGTENTLSNAFIFVKADADGPDASDVYDYKYIAVELTGGQTSTVVKHVEAGSQVYVLANASYYTKAQADQFASSVNSQAATFHELIHAIDKPYVSKLNTSTGSFIMSGKATVPALSNTGATVLSVSVKRDLAKVSFGVNKGDKAGDLRVSKVEEITVRRSVAAIQPFALNGTSPTTYVLPVGFGDSGYTQDRWNATNSSFDHNNDEQSAGATDFTFQYTDKDLVKEDATSYVFKNFYVLPNAAVTAEKSTIIVLKAKVEKKGTDDAWTELQGSRYYKARISSGIDSYVTAQNSSYAIIATIKGEGNTTPGGTGPDSPDAEDTDSDLNINVQVEPWSLVISNQEIQ